MELDVKQLAMAVKTIAEEKNLPEEVVQEVVEQALAAAYRRDFGDREQEVRVTMNINSGEVDAYVSKEVVEKVGDERFEISLKDAGVMKKNAAIGDLIEIHEKVENFGKLKTLVAWPLKPQSKLYCNDFVKQSVKLSWLSMKIKSAQL
jgi:transcription termination/antitermination protein NusA